MCKKFCMYLLVVVALLFVTSSEVQGSCKHWTVGKYMLCDEKLGVLAARKKCESYNATLATIQTIEDQEQVQKEMGFVSNCNLHGGGSPNLAYIGLNDVEVDKTWRWPDGRILDGYTQWHKDSNPCHNQPNGNTTCNRKTVIDQDYVAIQRCSGRNYGNWFDVAGDKALVFVCQRKNPQEKNTLILGTKQQEENSNSILSSTATPKTRRGASANSADTKDENTSESKQSDKTQKQGDSADNARTTKTENTRPGTSINTGALNQDEDTATSEKASKTQKEKGASKNRRTTTTAMTKTKSEDSRNSGSMNQNEDTETSEKTSKTQKGKGASINRRATTTAMPKTRSGGSRNSGAPNQDDNAAAQEQTRKTQKRKGASKNKSTTTAAMSKTRASKNSDGGSTKSTTESMSQSTRSGTQDKKLPRKKFSSSADSSSKSTAASSQNAPSKTSGAELTTQNLENSETNAISRTTVSEKFGTSTNNNLQVIAVGNPTPNTPSSDTKNTGASNINGGISTSVDDDEEKDGVKDQLKCLMLSLQPETRSLTRYRRLCAEYSSPFKFLDPNPVIAFEDSIASSAANLIIQTETNRSVRASIPGIDLTITPMLDKRARSSQDITVHLDGKKDCDYCDAVTLDQNNVLESGHGAVLVSAVLKEGLLQNTGVYDEIQEKKAGLDKTTEFIQKSTSVLSVSLYIPDETTKSVRKVSIPAYMKFNIRDDDSEHLLQEHSRIVTEVSRKCVYFDAHTSKWSTFGCKAFVDDTDHVRCECNHTTSFAVMVSLTSFEIPQWEKTLLLFTEIIGVVFLCLTLCLLIWMRRTLRKDRVLTQINLTLSLILMHVFMLIGEYSTTIEGLCVTMTFLSHFFMISSALWMLNEGLVLYKKTCGSALNFNIEKLKKWLLVLGWGVPAVYVIICLGIGLGVDVYMDKSAGYKATLERKGSEEAEDIRKYDRCWLGSKTKMILAGLIPLAISLLVTMYFLIRVSRVIWFMNVQAEHMRPSDTAEKRTPIKATFRAVALLLPVLGIPWLLAFTVNIQGAEIVFVAIHGIANGLQGVFIFIIYIVANGDARVVAKRRMTRSRLSTSTGFSFSASTSVMSIKRLTRGPRKSKKSVSTVSASTNHSSSV